MEAVLTFAGAAADQLPVHRVVHVCASVLRPRDHGRVDRGLLQVRPHSSRSMTVLPHARYYSHSVSCYAISGAYTAYRATSHDRPRRPSRDRPGHVCYLPTRDSVGVEIVGGDGSIEAGAGPPYRAMRCPVLT
eukprot:1464077-Rhodomonas_salina.2